VIVAALHDYLPLADFVEILVTALVVAVVAPAAAALTIDGFEARAAGRGAGAVVRIGVGAAVVAGLVVVGIAALVNASS
jgi:hypothetical protein